MLGFGVVGLGRSGVLSGGLRETGGAVVGRVARLIVGGGGDVAVSLGEGSGKAQSIVSP